MSHEGGSTAGAEKRAVLIAGPTASGKSALALSLAERAGGVIINADSMQVYRDLRIITARPTPEDEARAPHRLYGHLDAAETYSAGRWLLDAHGAIAESDAMGRAPIFAGGTGLYFKVLTQGLAAVPPIPADIREGVRARVAAEGAETLHAELAVRDPVTARRIRPADRPRVARALEVIEATGRSLSEWHREGLPPIVDQTRAIKVFLTPERSELKKRIEQRFADMLASGALEEVRALASRRLDPLMPAMKAHGVPWLIRHLTGEMALDEATAQAIRDTYRYTKRQFTWFRHQLPGWEWVDPAEAEHAVLNSLSQD